MKKFLVLVVVFSLTLGMLNFVVGADDINSDNSLIAFPGAEGGGKYTSGGRGGDVYVVTNLNDSGAGSLREGLKKGNRIIVFAVGGTIRLKSGISVAYDNTTILGQTAPGDGITLAGNMISVKDGLNNIIIRYIKVRSGDESGREVDALSARFIDGLIIDHCSFSWAVDEVCSVYGAKNATVSWNIISEPLALSAHHKGKHGYNGIWGGNNISYHHNLLSSGGNRNPRITAEAYSKNGIQESGSAIDIRNNVVYNWGDNAGYGGDMGDIYTNPIQNIARYNIENNYYKYGLSTPSNKRQRIFQVDGGKCYIENNYVEWSEAVTNDNWHGTDINGNTGVTKTVTEEESTYRLTEPVVVTPLDNMNENPQESYRRVMAGAGAAYPKRDAIDARIVAQAESRTGKIINVPSEAGGFLNLPMTKNSDDFDTDLDGIPENWDNSEWKSAKANGAKSSGISPSGYAWIEVYTNSLVSDTAKGVLNPNIEILSPQRQDFVKAGDTVEIHLTAKSTSNGEITGIELFDSAVKIGALSGNETQFNLDNIADGTHYITAIAYDSNGYSAMSTPLVFYANSVENVKPYWESMDIGTNITGEGKTFQGISHLNQNGTYTLKGYGRISSSKDVFHYMYKEVDGDFEFTTRIDSISKYDIGLRSGIMIRDSLDPKSSFAMISIDYEKGGIPAMLGYRDALGATAIWNELTPRIDIENLVFDVEPPYWVKMVRKGNDITVYYSPDGISWEDDSIGRLPQTITLGNLGSRALVGLAVDSASNAEVIQDYAQSTFSNVSLIGDNIKGDNMIEILDVNSSELYRGDLNVRTRVNADIVNKVNLYVDGKLEVSLIPDSDGYTQACIKGLTKGKHMLKAEGIVDDYIFDTDTLYVNIGANLDGFTDDFNKTINRNWAYPTTYNAYHVEENVSGDNTGMIKLERTDPGTVTSRLSIKTATQRGFALDNGFKILFKDQNSNFIYFVRTPGNLNLFNIRFYDNYIQYYNGAVRTYLKDLTGNNLKYEPDKWYSVEILSDMFNNNDNNKIMYNLYVYQSDSYDGEYRLIGYANGIPQAMLSAEEYNSASDDNSAQYMYFEACRDGVGTLYLDDVYMYQYGDNVYRDSDGNISDSDNYEFFEKTIAFNDTDMLKYSIIKALYNNGTFLATNIENIESDRRIKSIRLSREELFSQDAEKVKVFIWDNINNIQPKSEVVEINN